MKKLFAAIAAGITVAVFGAIVGCASVTPAQIAATLCVPTETAISEINLIAQQYPTDAAVVAGSAALKVINPTITAACSAASTVTSDNVQSLITQGLPAIGTILGTLPIPAGTLTTIEADFTLAEQAIDLVDVVVTSIKTAQADPVSAKASVMKMAAKPVQ